MIHSTLDLHVKNPRFILQIEGFIDSWVLPPMVERYTTACKSLNTGELICSPVKKLKIC